MGKNTKQHLGWLLAFCVLFSQVISTQTVFAQTAATDRIAGDDRYTTAVSISQKGWKTADYAVLARGDNFADALCAGPLAYKYGGPILLTEPTRLNQDTLAELKRLGVKHLFITGGFEAISQNIEVVVKAAGITDIQRIYGDTRYETSIKIAEKLGNSSKIVLATGSNFPDALSVSVIASKLGMPILLTPQESLTANVANYIKGKSITQTYLIGGLGVINAEVEKQVPGPARLVGTDRYETNVAVLKNFEKDLNFENIYIATGGGTLGTQFADALTGAVLAAKKSSPLILTGNSLSSATADYLKGKIVLATKAIGLGGQESVSPSVLKEIISYKNQIIVSQKYDKAGTYGPETGSKTVAGSVTICAADVILRNTIIEGDLLLAQSIGDGNVTLRNVTVKGKTIVNGGGPNSVIMYNFNGQTVVVDVPEGGNVRLVAQGNTSISSVTMESNGRLEESGLTSTGFVNVTIPEGAQVTLSGSFSQVNVEAGGANVIVSSGSIATMTIADTAAGAGINLAGGTSVGTFNANASATVTGQGQITTANVNTNHVTIAQTPANITLASGVTASVGGRQQTGRAAQPSSGGGGGGGGNNSISATAITNATVGVTKGSIDFSYNFKAGSANVTFGQVQAAPYYLDITNSTAQLKTESIAGPSLLSSPMPLANLLIGNNGELIYNDFNSMAAAFGNFQNPPTHIKLHLVSKTSVNAATVSNPWTYDTDWISFNSAQTDVFNLYGDKESLLIKDNAGLPLSGAALLNITTDLVLDNTGLFGSAVTWQSADTGVIANNGAVTRPASNQSDVNVALTATITKGALTETKVFNVTVKKQSTVNAPNVVSLVGAEGGAEEAGLGAGDTLTLTFDVATNQTPGAPGSLNKAAVDAIVDFAVAGNTGTVFGTDYTGQWTDNKNLVVTMVDAAGANWVIGNKVAIKAGAAIKTQNGLSPASTSTSGASVGSFDPSLAAPAIQSVVGAESGAPELGLGAGDTLTINFNVATNQTPGAPGSLNKAAVDAIVDFAVAGNTGTVFGTDYTGQWMDNKTLVIQIVNAAGADWVIGNKVAIKAGAGIKTQNGLSPASASTSGASVGSFNPAD